MQKRSRCLKWTILTARETVPQAGRPRFISVTGGHADTERPRQPKPAGRPHESDQDQKSQSSSSVLTALPMTYDDPDPEKKSWFSSAFGDRAERMAGFTSVMFFGNIGS